MRDHAHRRLLPWLMLPLLAAGGRAVWGGDGHKIVAQIAYDNLTPKTRVQVDKLLDGDTLAAFAVWPDAVKHVPHYAWTAPWHFADLPEGATEFDLQRDCPEEGCVVRGILEYAGVLASTDATKDQRVEALKFLAHYVGDVHQPLHVGHQQDRGGNDIAVKFFGSSKSLHAVWDEALIHRVGLDWTDYASKLEQQLQPADRTKWEADIDPASWATASHRLAEDHAYRDTDGKPIASGAELGEAYAHASLAIVDEQLLKAGLRLARMLNSIFDPAAVGGAIAAADKVMFVGSRKSHVYHLPGCKDVDNIDADNLVQYRVAPPGKRLHKGCPR